MEKPKILIVDDLIENLVSLELLLSDFNVEFERATSGMEALRKSVKDDFAMAILDVQMPGMDGYETLSLMRQRKKTKYLPVIFVSAIHQSDLHIIKGIETGAVDFIPKPIIPEILVGKVRIFLDLYHQKQELNSLLFQLKENNRELEIQKRKAEEAARAKSMFLANMSHEIRTPLNGIIGISRILERTELKPDQKELTEIITSSGENLLNIINDILDFSKIESGQIQLEKIPFELRKIIKTIISLLKFKADEIGLEIRVAIDGNIPKTLIGDPLRINQIITNLANNAIKFTEKGYVEISAAIVEQTEEDIEILIRVTDTGIGISDEGKTKLFKEFSQTETSTTRKYGGTGLGLAICNNLTQLMGGEIGVESEINHGSVFWAKLKFGKLDKTNHSAKLAELDIPDNIRVLYAEDNIVNQKVALLLLQHLGISSDIAVNGQQAVDKHSAHPYDLILMDMQMPVLDGIGATEKIRDIETKSNIVKPAYIVAVTANTFSEDKQKCIAAGMNEFISKPFNENELRSIVKNAIRRQQIK